MRYPRLSPLVGLVLLVLALGVGAFAQNVSTGELRGTVMDPVGAVVPDVEVTLTNAGTGAVAVRTTSATGAYAFPLLQVGRYTISFSKDGFRRFVQTDVDIHVGLQTINPTMEVGAVTEEISIQASAPLIQTETAARETTLESTAVANLPTVGRAWYNFISAMPGIAPGQEGRSEGSDVSINGTQQYQSAWLQDGASATMPVSQNPSLVNQTPLEAIEEVHISTSNFSAEYGGGSSVFNVISKSGGNNFHGSAFWFVRNDVLRARGYYSASKPPLRWNQIGGTVGGPILRDKLFFFGSFQREITRSYSDRFWTFPTAAMKLGDFSDPIFPTIYDPDSLTYVGGQAVRTAYPGNKLVPSDIDTVSNNIQSYFPSPSLPGIANNFQLYLRRPGFTQYINEKVDYNVGKHRFTVTGAFIDTGGDGPDPREPMNASTMEAGEMKFGLSDTITFGPGALLNLSFAGIRAKWWPTPKSIGMGFPEKIGLKNAPADIFPDIRISGFVSTSISGGTRAYLTEGTYVPAGTMTLIRGNHVIKFGAEYDRFYQNYATWGDLSSGRFDFSGIFTRNPADSASTGIGYADFLFGLPETWQVNNPPVTGDHSGLVMGFVQDDFKVRPNLTVNLGLRWTGQFGWSEQYDRIGTFDPDIINPATNTPGAIWFAPEGGRRALQQSKYANFAPRVGFAWAPSSNWSVRGGYGMFHLIWGANSYTYGGYGVGLSVVGYETSTDKVTPIFKMSDGPPAPYYPTNESRTADLLNGQSIAYYPYDTAVPYVQQMQFDVQRQLPGQMAVTVGYVHTTSDNVSFTTDFNQVPENLLGPGDAQSRRPYPQYAGIRWFNFDGYSNYNAFQVTMKKRYSAGLTFMTNYTWAKTMDTGSGSGWGSGGIDNWQIAYPPESNYGLSSTHTPHFLNGSVVWEVPIGKNRQYLNRGGVVDAIIGGWQVSGIFQIRAGQVFTPGVSGANLSGSLAGNWRPNRISDGSLDNPTISRWFDTGAFERAAEYTFGNSGRNILYGPAWKLLDFSLAKTFSLPFLGEAGEADFRMDADNVLNHPNFALPNSSIGDSNAGVISSVASGSRDLQLGITLRF